MLRFYDREYYEDIEEYVILNENIWSEGRKHHSKRLLPVLNEEHELVCCAYQDIDANRQLRMLRELEAITELDIRILYSECEQVTIYDCNELAYYFALYLKKQGMPVKVVGELWERVGWQVEEERCFVSDHKNMRIYAEGTHPKSGNFEDDITRSASVEFECIDRLYEYGVQNGLIKNAEGDFEWLSKQLSGEAREIILSGNELDILNAYDMLLGNGIDILGFLCNKKSKHRVMGKEFLTREEVEKRCKNPILIECTSKNSAWGFGEVDYYEYIGYKRNQSYFLLRDYADISISCLAHILQGKRVILIGKLSLCKNIYRILKEHKNADIFYCDILQDYSEDVIEIPGIKADLLKDEDVCLLLEVQYRGSAKHVCELHNTYKNRLEMALGKWKIYNYTYYFSLCEVLISIQASGEKYTIPQLTPGKLLFNASELMCGNELFRSLLDGHPDILLMDFSFVDNNLYFVCVQLAEEEREDIINAFWSLCRALQGTDEAVSELFPERELFNQKFEQLLQYKDKFTSQELLVIIYISYAKMYGKEIDDIQNMAIYWEPHGCNRYLFQFFEEWLDSEKVCGISVNLQRNSWLRMGSYLRVFESSQGELPTSVSGVWNAMGDIGDRGGKWKKVIVKFEQIKTSPRETLAFICDEAEIPWSDTLLATTRHGEIEVYAVGRDVITGFDLKPVYNLYEEYFSEFDRFRICMMFYTLQKEGKYPCVNCTNFSKRELQEMFLKEFRFEEKIFFKDIKEKRMWRKEFMEQVQKRLQMTRMNEINKECQVIMR